METLGKILWIIIDYVVAFMTIGFGLIIVISFILAYFYDRIPQKILIGTTVFVTLLLIIFMSIYK
jgi:hypothetical protein